MIYVTGVTFVLEELILDHYCVQSHENNVVV